MSFTPLIMDIRTMNQENLNPSPRLLLAESKIYNTVVSVGNVVLRLFATLSSLPELGLG